MKCPKCNSAMESVPTAGGVADRCTVCEGLWFDMLEHEDLKGYAEVVDTGSVAQGALYNTLDRIKCPVCPDVAMLRMVDPAQPHIWFESCPTCYGRFFDAGEFRDYAEVTLGDMIKRFSAKPRT